MTTRITYGYHAGPFGGETDETVRKQRVRAALRDARRRFPTSIAREATLHDPERADGPIRVEVTIHDADITRYYR